MKVKKLIEILQREDPEKLVVLSGYTEENYFYRVRSIEDNYLFNEEEGSIGIQKLTSKLKGAGYSEEDIGIGDPCIVLWP